ncbi:MAG: fumarylacetoacetate hydrolase family protein [Acidimicrobiia bacterium]
MKLARFRHAGVTGVGVVSGDVITPAGDDIFLAAPVDEPIPLDAVELACPVSRDAQIVCVGLNYRDHAVETGAELPKEPLVFAKLPSSLVGPGQPIVIPEISEAVDYEAELGVVIGRQTRRIAPSEARSHVLGYTCVNDVSARDLQLGDGQWMRGKSLDTFCPVGPWIVTTDDIPDAQSLGIRCLVNDELVQDSSTANMLFDVDRIISHVSQAITLEPGDLIATGTPAGVGFTRSPARYLRPGDVVTVEIDRIGALTNPVSGQ